jgi:rhodanese-related sulfurtransferase
MKTANDLVAAAKTRIHEIDLQNADTAISEADVLIDVREADEFHAGHIPGAINIPRGLLEFKLSNQPEMGPRDQKLVLYCKTSGRAALAACSLKDMGYLQVLSIEGGFDAWSAAGKAIDIPQPPAND